MHRRFLFVISNDYDPWQRILSTFFFFGLIYFYFLASYLSLKWYNINKKWSRPINMPISVHISHIKDATVWIIWLPIQNQIAVNCFLIYMNVLLNFMLLVGIRCFELQPNSQWWLVAVLIRRGKRDVADSSPDLLNWKAILFIDKEEEESETSIFEHQSSKNWLQWLTWQWHFKGAIRVMVFLLTCFLFHVFQKGQRWLHPSVNLNQY